MTTLAITRRPIVLETRTSAAMQTEIMARQARIIARASLYGFTDAALAAQLFAAESSEAEFPVDYYRAGFVEAGAPSILPGWEYARTGAGTAMTEDGTVEHFATDVPRITDRGLLVEIPTTNLLLRSQEMDNASWGKVNAGTGTGPVVYATDIVAPDGTATADAVLFDRGATDTIGNYSLLTQAVTTTAALSYTGSIWLKGASFAGQLGLRHVGAGAYTPLDLTTDWQRFDLTETSAGGAWEIGLRGSFGLPQDFAVHMWGAQLSAGVRRSSYIPTAGATATRGGDAATVEASGGASGTVVIEFTAPVATGAAQALVGAGTSALLYLSASALYSSVGASFLNGLATVTPGDICRVAITWEPGRRTICLNGGTPRTAAVAPVVSTLALGATHDGGDNWFDGHLRRVLHSPRAVSDAELQAMTS